MDAKSAHELEQCDVLARGVLTDGQLNNMEVDKEVVRLSGTVVAELDGVMAKQLMTEACQIMKMVGNPNYGCADKCLECVDQVCTPGYMTSAGAVGYDARESGGSKAPLTKSLNLKTNRRNKGNLLGLQYNGKEAEVLSKIVELEMKDKERIGGILTWNVRGIGRSEKKGKIRKMMKERNVDILLLQETKKANVLE
ncbi:hypothetical protein CsSME_00042458 [Camellia sinensis var. sinensis]